MVRMDIPQNVAYILDRLRNSGFEAYAVGGCVRDSLLGRIPKDWDITTSALPEQVKAIFSRTIDTGIKHGTVTVMAEGQGVEVTTYRIDGEYIDGRHPEDVTFTPNLEEDLKRRDFTINAFVYNENEGVKDFFNGLKDLDDRIIRCVGNPEERFGEDALRILRAIRFSAALSFDIDPATYSAAVKLSENLKKVSVERIKSELDKILLSENPDYIWKLKEMGIASAVMPELNSVQLPETLMKALKLTPPSLSVRWAVLVYFLGASRAFLDKLKFDNKTADKILLFIDTYLRNTSSDAAVCLNNGPDIVLDKAADLDASREKQDSLRIFGRSLLKQIGDDNIFDYLDFVNAIKVNTEKDMINRLEKEIEGIIERKECFSLKKLAINGRDILTEKLAEGKEVGELLEYLLMQVIVSPEKNDREYLLSEARTYRNGKI